MTSDECYKGTRWRGKGCNCYGGGWESPWLDSKIGFDGLLKPKKKGIRTVSGFTSLLYNNKCIALEMNGERERPNAHKGKVIDVV